MATITSALDVAPITPAIGGVVKGIDISQPQSEEIVRELRKAWLDRGVLFFPKQEVTEEQLEAFVGNFGETIVEPTSPNPDTKVVHGGDTGGTKKVTEVWHADATWLAEPPAGTGLRLVKVPPVGGDTCWSNVTVAFDDLAEPLREMLQKLDAVHWMLPSLDAMGIGAFSEDIQYTHPVVTVHPETGARHCS